MAATFDTMATEVGLGLRGFVTDEVSTTYLTASLDSTSTTFTVADAKLVSTGLVQIDEELFWVVGKDEATNIVTVAPLGRGYLGSTATSHVNGASVTVDPDFTAMSIKGAINDTIGGVWPTLFQVKQTSVTAIGARVTYSLPADAQDVVSVSWQEPGPTMMWRPIRRYRVDTMADTTAFPTGRSIDILQAVIPGRRINVNYMTAPSPLVNGSDAFAATTGLLDSAKDVIVLGSVARLLGYVEDARIQPLSIEASERSEDVPSGSASRAAQYIYAQYRQRAEEERQELLRRYPSRSHLVR